MARLRRDRSVLQVMAKVCAECLYSANKIVSDERRDQIVHTCEQTEQGFTCHKATLAGIDVMCRGHWDRTKNATLRNRLAQQLNVVRYVRESDLRPVSK